jgi:nucleoside-diphosphate-sugar epimerase
MSDESDSRPDARRLPGPGPDLPLQVFVTGATGVIGRRVVAGLVGRGHTVTGLARSEGKADELRQARASSVRADLFDPEALAAAMTGHDAVVNLATHIPPMRRAMWRRAWAENDRIRREGSTAVVDAALTAGVAVVVQESLAFSYVDGGDRWLDESTPLVDNDLTSALTVAEGNARRFTAAGGRGIVLRFGRFYSADSGYLQAQIRSARWGLSTEIGDPDGYQPLIEADDAAAAVVAALVAAAGTYNVVDDDPLTRREIDDVFAGVAGRARLRRADRFARRSRMAAATFFRSNRASNRRFVDATGWHPRFASARAGIPAVAEALRTGKVVSAG